ncbi:MAG: hypothetical protein Q3Y08_07045 [Butyricicoccus sp.]|nr:hypothetical protein [Butyricicoccus sp.]
MAEKVEGSFVFTILDAEDSIWFVRGNNPLAIFRYDGFILYASTAALLTTVEKELRLSHSEEIHTEEGDILKIDRFGQTSFGHFTAGHPYFQMPWSSNNHWSDERDEIEAFDALFEIRKLFGVTSEQIQCCSTTGAARTKSRSCFYAPAFCRELLDQFEKAHSNIVL